jgi:putative nucleotide binding protein
LYSATIQPKKYEEFAYVLDFIPRGKSSIIKEREGPLIQAIGEDRLTLLEILANDNAKFLVGEKVSVGKESREKIISVLGKLNYDELTGQALSELQGVTEKLVQDNEKRFVEYFNELQPITPRLHALELIPGIGKTFMKQIVDQRERKKFVDFADLEKRVGVRDPAKLVARRIIEELSGGSRILIFVRH